MGGCFSVRRHEELVMSDKMGLDPETALTHHQNLLPLCLGSFNKLWTLEHQLIFEALIDLILERVSKINLPAVGLWTQLE